MSTTLSWSDLNNAQLTSFSDTTYGIVDMESSNGGVSSAILNPIEFANDILAKTDAEYLTKGLVFPDATIDGAYVAINDIINYLNSISYIVTVLPGNTVPAYCSNGETPSNNICNSGVYISGAQFCSAGFPTGTDCGAFDGSVYIAAFNPSLPSIF